MMRLTHAQILAGPNAELHRKKMALALENGRAVCAENRERIKVQKAGKPGLFNPDKYKCWAFPGFKKEESK